MNKTTDVKKSAYNPPQRIEFLSDGSVVEFQNTLPKSTHRSYLTYLYRYTVSSTKFGLDLKLREIDLEVMKKNQRILIS